MSKASRTVKRPLNGELCPSDEGAICLAIGMQPETAVKRFGHIAVESTCSVSYDICRPQTQIYSCFHRALHSRETRPSRSLINPFPPPKNSTPHSSKSIIRPTLLLRPHLLIMRLSMNLFLRLIRRHNLLFAKCTLISPHTPH